MTEERRFPLAQAHAVAEVLRGLLAPGCERIEIAGSIRRRKPTVKDIELVAVPRIEQRAGADLWGGTDAIDLLDERIASLGIQLGLVQVRRTTGHVEYQHRNGPSYKRLDHAGMPVDLFIVRPPAEWGVLFAIRTGPGDWNERIVTDCQRFFRRVQGGQVFHLGRPVPCPEEADFFRAVGQPWVEPEDRALDRVAIVNPARLEAWS